MTSLGFHHSLASVSAMRRAVGGQDSLHDSSLQLLHGEDPWKMPGQDQQDFSEGTNALLEHSASCFLLQDADQFLLWCRFPRHSVLLPLCRGLVVVDAQS